jgi:hypothetical protein
MHIQYIYILYVYVISLATCQGELQLHIMAPGKNSNCKDFKARIRICIADSVRVCILFN